MYAYKAGSNFVIAMATVATAAPCLAQTQPLPSWSDQMKALEPIGIGS